MNRNKLLTLVVLLAIIVLKKAQVDAKTPTKFESDFKLWSSAGQDGVSGIIPLPDGRFFFIYKGVLYSTTKKWLNFSKINTDWRVIKYSENLNGRNDKNNFLLLGVTCESEKCIFFININSENFLLKSQDDDLNTPEAKDFLLVALTKNA